MTTENPSLSRQEALDLFSDLLGGEHHVPKLKVVDPENWGVGWRISWSADLSTYDMDLLTRAVFLAHDRCYRLEISACNFHWISLVLHRRGRREGGSQWNRHPTIETALAKWRTRHPNPEEKPADEPT